MSSFLYFLFLRFLSTWPPITVTGGLFVTISICRPFVDDAIFHWVLRRLLPPAAWIVLYIWIGLLLDWLAADCILTHERARDWADEPVSNFIFR
jgi:hypothetical protein